MGSSNITSVTNLIPTANEGFTTTVASPGVSSGGTTVPLAGISGLTNGTIFVGIVEPGLTNEQTFTGTVDTAGTQITGVVWTRGTNAAHAIGVTVVDYTTGTDFNMLAKATSNHTDQDGTLKAGAVDATAVIADGVVTAAKLASDAVTTVKILDANVTTAKVADAAITSAKVSGINKSLLTTDSNPYKIRVKKIVGNQAMADATFTTITFDSVFFDTNSNFVTSTYTVPVSGFYQVNLQCTFGNNTKVGSYAMGVLRNGSFVGYIDQAANLGQTQQYAGLSYGQLHQFTAADLITFQAYADTTDGTTTDIIADGAKGTQASIYLVSRS